MPKQINSAVVVGGGSAGFLAALTFRKRFPNCDLTLLHSPEIPVIGVGESTTPAVPNFLHNDLGIDRNEFFRAARPSWKLGLRMEWGAKGVSHFNYPFDWGATAAIASSRKPIGFFLLEEIDDCSLFSALMDRNLSPCSLQNGQHVVDQRTAYHIRNDLFLSYLSKLVVEAGTQVIEGEVVSVEQDESGDVSQLKLRDGQSISADFFIDCSGYRSLLLNETLGEDYVGYEQTLNCDTVIIGSWSRDDEVRPYTTAETMNHGWGWRIEFLDFVTRGYVYSSKFCDPDEAAREFREKNPELPDDLHTITFPRGRYQNFWSKNVAAIGNASGFVEPLEATALHLIVEQLHFLTLALGHSDMHIVPAARDMENQRFRRMWDDVRDFLALHYKFNHRLDTPFWRHCREHTTLGGAEPIVEYFRQVGPSPLGVALTDPVGIFRNHGYQILMLGQRVGTETPVRLTDSDRAAWNQYREQVRQTAATALPMREALQAFAAE